MIDIAFLVCGVALLGLIGVPAALLLPPSVPARLSLAPLFGYCVVAILSPNLFQAGLAMRRQLWLYGALAAMGLVLILLRRGPAAGTRAGSRGEGLRLAAAWAAAAVVLTLPKWIAGEEYYAYLGNIWDYFNYVTGGTIAATADPTTLQGFTIADRAAVLANPMLPWTHQLEERASIMMTFAALAYAGIALKLPLFELANDFMSLTLSFYVFGLYFLLRNATTAGPLARLVIPLVFVGGFWGGYLLDVDAWAQLAAVMVMPALFALGIEPLETGEDAAATSIRHRIRRGLGLSILAGATIYLYPELVPVYVVIYCASLLAALWTGGFRLYRILPQFVAAGLGLLLVAPFSVRTLGYLSSQLHTIASNPKLSAALFDYFHAFLLGGADLSAFTRAGASLLTRSYKSVNAAGGVAGLYRLVPASSAPSWLSAGCALATAGLLAALAWCALCSLKLRDLWLPAALLTGAALVATLALQHNLYGAGKIFFWLSPFILLLLLWPPADARAGHWRKLPAYAYVCLQAVSLVLRLHSVAVDYGIPAAPPYPGEHEPQRKPQIELNLARLFDRLDQCRLVRVDMKDPFLRHYVMVNLFAREIPYFSSAEINSYYDEGEGVDLGLQTPAAPPDCTVRLGAPGTGSSGRQALVVEPAAG
ncbi:MAG: hypothetical protein ACHQRJ_02305 [Alphaproteobacteria bacterium]